MPINKEINLLDLETLEERPLGLRKRSKTSFVILLLFLAVGGGIFYYYYLLQNQLEDIQNKAQLKEQEVLSFQSVEEKYLVKKDKLSAISEIVNKRPNLVPLMDLLQNATPEGISYTSIGIPGPDIINLSGTAENSTILTLYFYTLSEDINFTKYLKEVSMNNLILDKDKKYAFDLTLKVAPIK